ncbi:MAG: CRISPR-associated endonuclease Cas2 [Nitrososphaerales archaeon]
MRYLIIYDITLDNLRSYVAEKLKDYGLKRIQKSAFIGDLERFRLNSLVIELNKVIVDDNVKIFPLCSADYKGRISIGKEFEEDKEKTLIV